MNIIYIHLQDPAQNLICQMAKLLTIDLQQMEGTPSGPEHTTSVILDITLLVYMVQEEESAVHLESGIGIGTPCGV